jgi:hypothetical protein
LLEDFYIFAFPIRVLKMSAQSRQSQLHTTVLFLATARALRQQYQGPLLLAIG